MHSLCTIIKINQLAVEPTRNNISSQAKWVLSLLTITERSLFASSGRLPDEKRNLSASREALMFHCWRPAHYLNFRNRNYSAHTMIGRHNWLGRFDPDCDARHFGKVAKQEKYNV